MRRRRGVNTSCRPAATDICCSSSRRGQCLCVRRTDGRQREINSTARPAAGPSRLIPASIKQSQHAPLLLHAHTHARFCRSFVDPRPTFRGVAAPSNVLQNNVDCYSPSWLQCCEAGSQCNQLIFFCFSSYTVLQPFKFSHFSRSEYHISDLSPTSLCRSLASLSPACT